VTEITTAPLGNVRVQYNHYNSEFTLVHGAGGLTARLAWAAVDAEYCIGYVFRGDPAVRLVEAGGAAIERDADGYFDGLTAEAAYVLQVAEDEAAEAAAPRRNAPYRGPSHPEEQTRGVSRASAALTEELKKLSLEELAAQSDRYRALREARDLEDCVFAAG